MAADQLFYTQQPTKNRQTRWRRVGRGGSTIRERVGSVIALILEEIWTTEKNQNINTLALAGRKQEDAVEKIRESVCVCVVFPPVMSAVFPYSELPQLGIVLLMTS